MGLVVDAVFEVATQAPPFRGALRGRQGQQQQPQHRRQRQGGAAGGGKEEGSGGRSSR